jgi:hypothetical protein
MKSWADGSLLQAAVTTTKRILSDDLPAMMPLESAGFSFGSSDRLESVHGIQILLVSRDFFLATVLPGSPRCPII